MIAPFAEWHDYQRAAGVLGHALGLEEREEIELRALLEAARTEREPARLREARRCVCVFLGKLAERFDRCAGFPVLPIGSQGDERSTS